MNIHTLQVHLLFAVSRNLAYSTAVLISQADAMVSYTFGCCRLSLTTHGYSTHKSIFQKIKSGTGSGSDIGRTSAEGPP